MDKSFAQNRANALKKERVESGQQLKTSQVFFRRVKTVLRRNMKFIVPVFVIVAVLIILQVTGVTKISEISVVNHQGGELKYVNSQQLEESLNKEFLDNGFYSLSSIEVENRVKGISSYVDEVYVRKIFPSYVKVSIIEREPKLVISNNTLCTLLDDQRWVLEHDELSGDECLSKWSSLDILEVVTADQLADFVKGDKAQFYDFDDMVITRDILLQNGYSVDQVLLADGMYEFIVTGDKRVKFSSKEEWEIQHKRLIIVLAELDAQSVSFKSIDVRYNRPVFIKD